MKYKITLSGFGMELVMGKISNIAYDYFQKNNITIDNYINNLDITKKIPKKFQPFPADQWFECDDLVHLYNVILDNDKQEGLLTIEQDKKIIKKYELDTDTLAKEGIIVDEIEEIYVSEQPNNTCVFLGQSNEKGVFFTTEIEDKKFDQKKIKIEYKDIEGILIVSSVFYNNKKLKSKELSTTGNSTEYSIYKNKD
jgi:hypothetical protein